LVTPVRSPLPIHHTTGNTDILHRRQLTEQASSPTASQASTVHFPVPTCR
jgi:hypothetical protein